jgi:hypothetical protein
VARTALTLLTADRDGVSIADAALTDANTDGHSFENDGATVLVIQNTNGAGRTLTIKTPGVVDGDLAIAERTISVAATTGRLITATFPRTIYNQTDGTVHVDVSATAGLKLAAVKIPRELIA